MRLVWGANACRVLAKAFRLTRTFPMHCLGGLMKSKIKVRFGRMPKPARWKRALPRDCEGRGDQHLGFDPNCWAQRD
jgi:hypothetical protein